MLYGANGKWNRTFKNPKPIKYFVTSNIKDKTEKCATKAFVHIINDVD